MVDGGSLGLAGGADENGLRKGSARLEMVAELVQHGVNMGKNRSMPIICRSSGHRGPSIHNQAEGYNRATLESCQSDAGIIGVAAVHTGPHPGTPSRPLTVSPLLRLFHGDEHRILFSFCKK